MRGVVVTLLYDLTDMTIKIEITTLVSTRKKIVQVERLTDVCCGFLKVYSCCFEMINVVHEITSNKSSKNIRAFIPKPLSPSNQVVLYRLLN